MEEQLSFDLKSEKTSDHFSNTTILTCKKCGCEKTIKELKDTDHNTCFVENDDDKN